MLLAVLFFYDRATFADTRGEELVSDLRTFSFQPSEVVKIFSFDFSQVATK